MLVVRCRNPNSAERELIEAIKDLDGVAFIGYMVAQGEREREIDALVFTPVRAVAIEVKAPMLATPREGELVPYVNAPWTIGGDKAQFYGGSNPIGQAKVGAQIFATFLRERMEKTPFVQVAVSIADGDLTMSEGPKMIGQTAVGLTSQIVEALELMKKKAIPLEMVLEMIEVMELEILAPSRASVEKEWANAKELQANSAPPSSPSKSRNSARRKDSAEPEKSPFFEFMEKLSHSFNTVTIIFLFVWFLYTLGILDGITLLFDSLSQFVDGLTNPPSSGG